MKKQKSGPLTVLHECDAASVHTHMIARAQGVANSPLHRVQSDPFLRHEPSADPA
jgi:hypothetical protein